MNLERAAIMTLDWQAWLKQPFDGSDSLLERTLNTWLPVQAFIILLSFLCAVVAERWIVPPLEERLRQIEKQPRLIRTLVLLLRRLKWIIFALLLWSASAILTEFTRESRSYFVYVAASLATAWVITSIVARLFRNRSIGTIVGVTVWLFAAIDIIGFLPEVIAILDGAAFSLGNFRISLLVIGKAVLFLTVLLWLAGLSGDFIEQRIENGLDVSPTARVLLTKAVKAALVLAAFLISLQATGIDLTALALFSGAVGIGVGFGLQKVASNLISGIIILIDKSIKPGDVISVGNRFGWITSLRGRYVSVETREGVEYLIPNETFITDQVINWSYSNKAIRLEIKFGVSYDSNPHKVRELATAAIKELSRVKSSEPAVCHLVGFGESSLDFVLRFWIDDPEEGLTNIRGAAYLALWDAFKEAGIGIPYPHREIILRNPAPVAED